MNKIRYYISMFLAAVGMGTATAQQYEAGAQVTDIDAVASAGTEVLLAASTVQSYNPGKYITPEGFVTTPTADAVYKFEATGETFEGLPTFRLVHVADGKYLRAEQYGSNEDTSGGVTGSTHMHTYTTDVKSAYTFTATHPIEGATDVRYKTNTMDEEAWIFCETTEQPDGMGYGFFGTYGDGFLSIYTDTNIWNVYVASKLSGADELNALINTLLPNGMSDYTSGTEPGQLNPTVYNNLKAAFDDASTKGSDQTLDASVYTAAMEALQAAYDAIEGGINGVEVGKYYYFFSQRSSDAMYDGGSALYCKSGYSVPDTESATIDDAKYIFQVVQIGDKLYLQNFATSRYAGTLSYGSTLIPSTQDPSAEATITYVTRGSNNETGCFNVKVGSQYYHCDASSQVVGWWDTKSPGDLWKIQTVDNAIISKFQAEIEQNRLNSELNELYLKASATYAKSRNYTSDAATADGNFDDMGLVTDGSKLSTNAEETAEATEENPTQGYVSCLVDGDFTSFFHSRWQSGDDNPTTYHYVQADLGEAVQTLVLKYAKRHNNQTTYNPTQILVYGADSPEGPWTLAGSYPLTYTYSAIVNEEETANFVGMRGIELDAPHQYVRIAVTAHQKTGGLLNGYPYFYLSELHFYKGEYDASTSSYEQVSAATASAFQTALKSAANVIAAGSATQTDITTLNAAYEAFLAEFPDPQVLKDSLEAAKNILNTYPFGTELGYFNEETQSQLSEAIDNVEATITDVMTLDAIQSGLATLRQALAAVEASLIYPETGKVYILRGLTSDTNNARALNAMVYATSNDTEAYLKSMAQVEGADAEDYHEHINYLWKAVKVENGKIILRNIATGFYMNSQSSLNGGITTTEEPVELGIRSAGVAGGFNIIVGDNLYVNFQGQGVNMVAWNTASGSDNSSILFEPIDLDSDPLNGTTSWTLNSTSYQVLTLPFSYMVPGSDEGTSYEVLGQYTDGENYSIELKQLADDAIVEAGEPIVFLPATGVTAITCLLSDADASDMTYAKEGTTSSNGALTGVLASKLITTGKAYLNNGKAIVSGPSSTDRDNTIAANTGYFNDVTTTEKGDVSIALSAAISTSISAAEVLSGNESVNVFTTSGVLVRKNVKAAVATKGLPAGLYIVGGKTTFVK